MAFADMVTGKHLLILINGIQKHQAEIGMAVGGKVTEEKEKTHKRKRRRSFSRNTQASHAFPYDFCDANL